ncbi:MAG: DHA2 family efflux MFS transporter permease subunit [Cetobacterium sp.]
MKETDKIILMICLCTGAFMNLLDTTIVNVSIPHIAGSFGVATSDGTWVITSYAVSEAILLPLIGWLSSRIGIIKQYLCATVIFALISALCGISPNFETMLFFRVLQGVVGASMIPLSQTLMTALYPPEKRSFPLGIWSMTVVFAPIVGPILGGWITDNLNWRWAFYINLPLGIVSTYIAHLIYKKYDINDKTSKTSVDKWGIIFLALGVGSLQIMLDKGNEYNWFSNMTIVVLALSAFVFLIIMVIWEWDNNNPVVNVRLFLRRNFLVGSFCLFAAVAVIYAMVIVLPLWLQEYMGYTAFKSGLTLFYQALPVLFCAPILGKYGSKIDARKAMSLGFLIMGLVAIFISYPPNASQGYISYTRFLFGFGMALFFVPANILALSGIPQDKVADASGIFNFMRNMGISFGTALSINYWDNKVSFFHSELASSINSSNPNFSSYMSTLPGTYQDKLAIINQEVTNQAATMGMNQIFYITGIILICIIPFIFIAKSTIKK